MFGIQTREKIMEQYDALVKLKSIIEEAESIAEKYLDLIKLENGEKNISNLLETKAKKLITQFSDSYSKLDNLSSKIEETTANFINDSFKPITSYTTFFNKTLSTLKYIKKLVIDEINSKTIWSSS